MKIYDVSQPLFGCKVYPGDPSPERRLVYSIKNGDPYNLTAISMCAHNGTHVDAPAHFIDGGKTVDDISLSKTVGYCFVIGFKGLLTADDAREILKKTYQTDTEAAKRLLFKGDMTVSSEAAEVFAAARLFLLGNESQTVGPEDAPMRAHKALLSAETVLLEGIRLSAVPDGVYFLNAAPLYLQGSDGAPCRAILIDMNE